MNIFLVKRHQTIERSVVFFFFFNVLEGVAEIQLYFSKLSFSLLLSRAVVSKLLLIVYVYQ